MADKKISQLPSASTPLAGTEVLPIVQSSTTDQVSVANLTAGRAVSAASLTLTGSALAIASGGTNQTAFTSPVGSVAGLVWFDGTSFQNDSTTSHVGYNSSTNVFYANTPTFSGDTTLSTGNLVIGTSGKGIDFSVTPNPAGMTSELLADYEEGTWTPVLVPGSGAIVSQTGTGDYVKIGKNVYIRGSVKVNDVGTAAGSMTVSGLPYTSLTTTIPTALGEGSASDIAGLYNLTFYIGSNTTSGLLFTSTNTNPAFTNLERYSCFATYLTA